MININIICKSNTWFKYIKNPNYFFHNKINNLNKNFKKYKNKKIFCTLLLSGSKEIKKLNKKFRKKNKTTDVLSFPNYDQNIMKAKLKSQKNLYLGDIALNLYKINKGKNKFKSEFDKLWVHGLVHLMGYRHYKNKDFFKMKKIEDKIIKQLKC